MNKIEQVKAAKEMGSKHRGVGLSNKENPYRKDTDLWKAWNKGWEQRDRKKRGLVP